MENLTWENTVPMVLVPILMEKQVTVRPHPAGGKSGHH